MTIIKDSSSRSGDTNSGPWQATMTERDAARNGIVKRLYQTLISFALMVVNEHRHLGTPRALWEPTTTQADFFTAPYVEEAEAQLGEALESEVDPALDTIRDFLETMRELIRDLTARCLPITTTELGINLSVPDAVLLVEQHGAQIEEDTRRGVHVHVRANPVLKWLGSKAPWFESLGMFAFVTLFLNVTLWRPQDDILGWTFAVTVVVTTVAGQIWLIHPAAAAQNHMREHEAAGNRHEAADSRSRRNRFLVWAGLVTTVVTGAMIFRGLSAIGDAAIHVTVIMIALAAVSGLLMPILAYLATALDGSQVSREHDDLSAALDADLNDELGTRDEADQHRDMVAESRDTLHDKTLPSIRGAAQETLDRVYFPYNAARMLIGGLAGEPPAPVPTTVHQSSASESATAYLSTSIPGARRVDLAPLLSRYRRLSGLDQQWKELSAELDSIPEHPWGKHRR